MNPQRHREDMKTKDHARHENHSETTNIDHAHDDGEVFFSEYSKVISDLLKDPVSLGLVGSNCNRGHQR